MERIKIAVSDTGPLLHLSEIKAMNLLDIFVQIVIPPEVVEELGKNNISLSVSILPEKMNAESKDYSRSLQERYGIDLGEAESIAIARQKGINLILTDDLDARTLAKRLGFEVHGSLGIVTRAYAVGLIGKDETVRIVTALHKESSLFLTKDLVDWVIGRIK